MAKSLVTGAILLKCGIFFGIDHLGSCIMRTWQGYDHAAGKNVALQLDPDADLRLTRIKFPCHVSTSTSALAQGMRVAQFNPSIATSDSVVLVYHVSQVIRADIRLLAFSPSRLLTLQGGEFSWIFASIEYPGRFSDNMSDHRWPARVGADFTTDSAHKALVSMT
ncbi:hypothetical protein NEOLEDRAFT_1171114 [Neolentinus lepideus HHB14362 ss-1]|uniref:Uncharacterized protein n=1 Tax=Neolentinus lepideus HHB14362 ss-1 TaxID=1314782 RepID=A0A165QSR9_9AGAM|nr:hypothetical protein NEOLEDRAFT_1171114 [Neolentinus lepideus HHB14362 ss-1]